MTDGLYGSLHIDRVGMFSHLAMSVWLADAMLDPKAFDEMEALPDTDESARLVVSALSVIHEMRHLHDCFSTPAGISLFRLEMDLLRGFWAFGAGLRKDGLQWRLPLSDWVKHPSCPVHVRRFYKWYSMLSVLRRAFIGRGAIGRGAGRVVEPWAAKMNGDGREVLAVPVNFLLKEDGREEHFHEWYPLGFEALIEGAANAVEKSLVEGLTSDALRQRIERRLTEIELPKSQKGDVGITLPYNITDYAVTRIMSGRYDRDVLTRLTDFALMDSAIAHQLTGSEGTIAERDAGRAFRDAIEHSRLREANSGSAVEDPGFTVAARNALRYCEGVQAFDECCGDEAIDPVTYIESFAATRLMRPLLKLRQSFGNTIFADSRKYLESFHQFPLAPVMVDKGQHRFGGLGDVFLRKWSGFLMLVSISKQVMSGAEVLHCPRAREAFPGLAGLDLCKTNGGCMGQLEANTCSPWVEGAIRSGCRTVGSTRR